MRMCQPHWDMLRQEVADQGLADWVAPSGEIAAQQVVDQVQRGEDTPVNYDPLMACFWMITSRTLDMVGLAAMTEDFGCPICRLNELRTEDGACKCDRPDCPAKTPGSVPDHEEWLRGPESCVTSSRKYMVEQGWISEESS